MPGTRSVRQAHAWVYTYGLVLNHRFCSAVLVYLRCAFPDIGKAPSLHPQHIYLYTHEYFDPRGSIEACLDFARVRGARARWSYSNGRMKFSG